VDKTPNQKRKGNEKMSTSVTAQLELREAFNELDAITRTPGKLNPEQQKRSAYLLAKISALKSGSLTTDEEVRERAAAAAKDAGVLPEMEEFRRFLQNDTGRFLYPHERRTYSGMNTGTGSNGGYYVPAAYMDELFQGMANFDPLLDENNVRLVKTDNARPMTIPGVDLSVISATKIAQGVDSPPAISPATNLPAISKNLLGGFSYRSDSIPATFELEQDSFESISKVLATAFGIGLARGIGQDLINGDGVTGPLGLLTAAANSGVTTSAAGVISATDLTAIYFSLNRAYRNSTKAAWVCSDVVYKMIRDAKFSSGQPVLDMTDDGEKLLGKKVLISPSMPSAATSKGIVFADLAQYVVRVAKDTVETRRNTQAPGFAENGIALYYSLMRADAALVAPGTTKPAVYATLHA
jgi:HK97 family phage major capsid protein